MLIHNQQKYVNLYFTAEIRLSTLYSKIYFSRKTFALYNCNFQVREGLASDETLKLQSEKYQKIHIGKFPVHIAEKSSLLHGALRIATSRQGLPIFDFILELLDMVGRFFYKF